VLTLSDEALLAGMGAGDPDSAAGFVRRFQARVFGLTLSILRDRGAAEEAAQETFVRAWRHASAFDPRRGTVVAWLLTIARNTSINMLPRRRPDPIDPEVLLTLREARPGPAEDDRTSDVSAALAAALDGLPEPQRRALVLATFYGFTAAEMSDLDGVPLGTVKTRIRSALMKLRTDLGVHDDR
jgi:RNA polymerase sigma factor (sigma-70 family)